MDSPSVRSETPISEEEMSETEDAKEDAQRLFLDVVSRIPTELVCVRCGKSSDNFPGGTVDMDSGFEVITDPKTGHRRQGGHICGRCMKPATA
jgi:hypothetical protein